MDFIPRSGNWEGDVTPFPPPASANASLEIQVMRTKATDFYKPNFQNWLEADCFFFFFFSKHVFWLYNNSSATIGLLADTYGKRNPKHNSNSKLTPNLIKYPNPTWTKNQIITLTLTFSRWRSLLEQNVLHCIFSVRLVDGSSANEGRVEVYYDGAWGTVCDDQWGIEDADAVCRSLGYSRAESSPGDAQYGEGTDPIYLNDVQCVGYEANVGYCGHAGVGVNNCGHDQDAGARCMFDGEHFVSLNDATQWSQIEIREYRPSFPLVYI